MGTKSNIAKSKVKVGIGEEKCNHPEGVNLVAMPGGFCCCCCFAFYFNFCLDFREDGGSGGKTRKTPSLNDGMTQRSKEGSGRNQSSKA